MRRFITPLLCCWSAVLFFARAADLPLEPQGVYKTIDVRLSLEAIKSLTESKGGDRTEMIQRITGKPENFSPPVFYFLSRVLFEEDQKDEAAFWFYAGQLRGRIDANICADKSARNAIDSLNRDFGPLINQYAFKDIPKLTNTVEKVLVWEKITPCAYDRRWINLRGMASMNDDTNSPLSKPTEQWEAIRKSTRDDYRSTFYAALAEFNKRKSEAKAAP